MKWTTFEYFSKNLQKEISFEINLFRDLDSESLINYAQVALQKCKIYMKTIFSFTDTRPYVLLPYTLYKGVDYCDCFLKIEIIKRQTLLSQNTVEMIIMSEDGIAIRRNNNV